PLTADDRVLHKTPASFDVSLWEMLWPLVAGAAVVVAPPGSHKDPATLATLIRRERVTVGHFVPSMLGAFGASGDLPSCSRARRIMASGEALVTSLAARAGAQTAASVHNLYGPTEAAIEVTSHLFRRDEDREASVPIGRPIGNVRTYVLDGCLMPVPA